MAPARGSSVKIVYSPDESLDLARAHPDKEVVFFGVGFETTIPSIAVSARTAAAEKLPNYSVLSALWTIPPALRAILESREIRLSPSSQCLALGLGVFIPGPLARRTPRMIAHHALVLNLHQPAGNLQAMLDADNWEAREILYALDRIPRSPTLETIEEIPLRIHREASSSLGRMPRRTIPLHTHAVSLEFQTQAGHHTLYGHHTLDRFVRFPHPFCLAPFRSNLSGLSPPEGVLLPSERTPYRLFGRSHTCLELIREVQTTGSAGGQRICRVSRPTPTVRNRSSQPWRLVAIS